MSHLNQSIRWRPNHPTETQDEAICSVRKWLITIRLWLVRLILNIFLTMKYSGYMSRAGVVAFQIYVNMDLDAFNRCRRKWIKPDIQVDIVFYSKFKRNQAIYEALDLRGPVFSDKFLPVRIQLWFSSHTIPEFKLLGPENVNAFQPLSTLLLSPKVLKWAAAETSPASFFSLFLLSPLLSLLLLLPLLRSLVLSGRPARPPNTMTSAFPPHAMTPEPNRWHKTPRPHHVWRGGGQGHCHFILPLLVGSLCNCRRRPHLGQALEGLRHPSTPWLAAPCRTPPTTSAWRRTATPLCTSWLLETTQTHAITHSAGSSDCLPIRA